MKVSISNIAWDKKDDEAVYAIMQENNVYGLDVAPARVFDHPFDVSSDEGRLFVEQLREKGIEPVGMQSLLYGTEGLQLFGDKENQQKTTKHLKKIMDYAAKIGVTRLVFGSPKNRIVADLSENEILQKSIQIFSELGNYAYANGQCFCIEPNPTLYGADYITETIQGIELVEKINNPGFRLHLDFGTILVNDENIEQVVKRAIPVTEHVHLSHPNLEQVIGNEAKHKLFRDALIKYHYEGTVAIEMKNTMQPNNIDRIRETIAFITSIYGGEK